MRIKITSVLLTLLVVAGSAAGAELSLGMQGGIYETAYRTRHADNWLLPYVGYSGEAWYIDGTEAGYNIINNDTQLFRAKLYYYSQQYRSSDGRNAALRSLNSRYSTMMAGLTYQYISAIGAFSTTAGVDTLNNSRGVVINTAYTLLHQSGKFTLVPEVGIDWSDTGNTRYYYGVSREESARSGLPVWHPHSSTVPYIQLAINYAWTPRWNSWGEITERFYPSAISQSPMVNKHNVTEFTVGVSYTF